MAPAYIGVGVAQALPLTVDAEESILASSARKRKGKMAEREGLSHSATFIAFLVAGASGCQRVQ